jgi:hypothetical protein
LVKVYWKKEMVERAIIRIIRNKIIEVYTQKNVHLSQYGGSGMFILDPDFYPSWILDLGSRIQKREVKKNLLSYFFL